MARVVASSDIRLAGVDWNHKRALQRRSVVCIGVPDGKEPHGQGGARACKEAQKKLTSTSTEPARSSSATSLASIADNLESEVLRALIM